MNSTRTKRAPGTAGRGKRPQMTAQQATMFERFSVGNATTAESALDCGCKAYVDVYTYNRWQAQGFQVKRGQRAVRLPMVKDVEREAENGETKTRRIFTSSSVFCRHQVEPIQATAEPTPTPPTPTKPQQPIENPTPGPQPRIDEIMGNWKEIS
jgi:hypothetical protein